ncbi:MAG: type II toxin-antitoxin system RelE/ParE family toxin [Syntrophomonas sp.]|nr:type II toxin-antitoxin system RelE/ParE family toxin [Syntrophomonas sp.]
MNSPFNRRIVDALRLLATDPKHKNLDIKPLEGRPGEYRLRVGRYRIIYTIDDYNYNINVP